MKNIALVVAGFIFGLVALAHLLRILFKISIVVSGSVVPMGVSYVGLVVALLLAIWMFAAFKSNSR